MTTLTVPWTALASSNTRNTRRGGKAHSWGYKLAREAIQMHAMDQIRGERPRHPEGRLQVTLAFHPPDFRRRDVANYAKVLLDAIQGVAYADDYQVSDLSIHRRDPDGEEPRVEIQIRSVP